MEVHTSCGRVGVLHLGLPSATQFPTRGFSLSFSLVDRLDMEICYFWEEGGLILRRKDTKGRDVPLRRRDLDSNYYFFSARGITQAGMGYVYGSP